MLRASHENSDPRLPLLNRIQIANPCHVAWNGMSGTERERLCESCSKTVHNLIEHTTDEAYRLVAAPDAHVCVRMHRDAAGNILTKDSLPATPSTRRSLLQRLGLLAASLFGLASTASCRRIEDFFSPPLQGAICPPPNAGPGRGNGSNNHAVIMGDIGPIPPQQKSHVGVWQCPPGGGTIRSELGPARNRLTLTADGRVTMRVEIIDSPGGDGLIETTGTYKLDGERFTSDAIDRGEPARLQVDGKQLILTLQSDPCEVYRFERISD